MLKSKLLFGSVAVAAVASAVIGQASAQVTTSSIRGVVTDEAGSPVSGATVTIVHVPTGTVNTTTTGATGAYNAQGLRVGGPFSITITGEGLVPSRAEDITTDLGDVTQVNITVAAAEEGRTLDTVVVRGSAVNVASVAIGPSASFGLDTLENAPAANRDIKDILRLDPRIFIDEAFVDAISCAGASPRFNSLTVDGVALNDKFGLNSNGYPTERIPFSYDSISNVSVELAPFDVQYGGFTACNINAVTKSGTNEFHGGLFYDYTSDSLTGDKTDGIDRTTGDFDEKRYGFTLGGPIIPDTLFFFGSYEKLEGVNLFSTTAEDVGISQAAYDALIAIAENQYGYVSGGQPTSKAVEDEKIFAKIDWNINENNRLALTYNYNDGFNYSPSDTFADGNHYYERGAKLEAYTASLYTDWTDKLSTELRIAYQDLDNRQRPVAGYDGFGEIQITVPRDLFGGSQRVYLGADDSRQANKLAYTNWTYKFLGTYAEGDHLFTAGIEREDFSVFNLFIQETMGEWRFDSPEDFANGDFNYFEYSNATGTNNQNDGAADFSYEINTAYLQDEWQVTPELKLTYGFRFDYYTSDDAPAYNPAFMDNYGFRNNYTLDDKSLFQPRIGFTYDYSDNISFRGGIGLFSGGNPNVWISNNYSNNGVTLADYIVRGGNINDYTYSDTGRPFFDVPDEGIDFIANATASGSVNALDPDFEIPSEWKFALGTTVEFETQLPMLGRDWRVMADYLYSKTNEAAVVLPLGYEKTGTAIDGRPIYSGNTNDFVLTNAEEKGYSQVFSVSVENGYSNGIDWSIGYAYTDAKDTNPMTSSVAFSNFANYTTFDPVNIDTATSDYEIAHRFTARFDYEFELVDRFPTRISLFGTASEGAPYSYVVASGSNFGSLGYFEPLSSTRQLAYIPTGMDDPAISPMSNMDAVADLIDFINASDVLSDEKGKIAERNIAADDWWTKIDLKLTQSFPGFRDGDSAQAFIVVKNLTNLINDEWGILREHPFPGDAALYSISGADAQGRYIISAFNQGADADSIVVNPSLWSIRLGVKYKF